jgi:hypothetical protein
MFFPADVGPHVLCVYEDGFVFVQVLLAWYAQFLGNSDAGAHLDTPAVFEREAGNGA